METHKVAVLLEELARMTVAIEGLSRNIADTVRDEERRRYSHNLKELLKGCYNLQSELGKECPELHPHFLGLENFSKLRKKYETPENPVTLPSKGEIVEAANFWNKYMNSGKK